MAAQKSLDSLCVGGFMVQIYALEAAARAFFETALVFSRKPFLNLRDTVPR